MSPAIRLPLPTSNWARLLLAPALIFIATAVERHYQTDFWHHLARGRATAEQGSLVNKDLFTYTVADQPLQDVNWLPQLFYYWLFQHGGLEMVQFVNSLTLAVMMLVLVWLCWRASGSAILASCLGVLTFFGLWQVLIIRPQTFSLLLFVVLYGVLQRADRQRWLLVLPPLFMALWANLHGAFPIGLALVGCFTAAAVWDAWRTRGYGALRDGRAWALILCLAVSMLATLANPYGWKVYQYVRLTSGVATGRHIEEWLPPSMNLFIGKVWMLSVLALIVLFATAKRRPTSREVCLVLCFLPLACSSVRMIPWWLLISMPMIASFLSERLPQAEMEPEKPSFAAAGFCAILLLGVVLSVPWLEPYNPVLSKVRDTHRIESDLEVIARTLPEDGNRRRIFSRFEWGEYLSWSLAPRYTVFMDGRIEIYPDQVWNDYSAVTRGRADWEAILDRYEVDYLLLDTSHNGDLLPQVQRSPIWKQISAVGTAVLFQRTAPLGAIARAPTMPPAP